MNIRSLVRWDCFCHQKSCRPPRLISSSILAMQGQTQVTSGSVDYKNSLRCSILLKSKPFRALDPISVDGFLPDSGKIVLKYVYFVQMIELMQGQSCHGAFTC